MAAQAHTVHGENMTCSSCHVQQVNSCFNCHFDTEVNEKMKKEYNNQGAVFRSLIDSSPIIISDGGEINWCFQGRG